MPNSIFPDGDGEVFSGDVFFASVKYKLFSVESSIDVTNVGDHSTRRASGLEDLRCEFSGVGRNDMEAGGLQEKSQPSHGGRLETWNLGECWLCETDGRAHQAFFSGLAVAAMAAYENRPSKSARRGRETKPRSEAAWPYGNRWITAQRGLPGFSNTADFRTTGQSVNSTQP